MSRRKKKQAFNPNTAITTSPVPAPPDAPPGPGPELLRRMLLLLLTVWLVARPLVVGDDPGMIYPWTSTTGLVLTQLLFVLAAGWAGWRWWSGQGHLHVGLVEVFLVFAVGFVLFSTNVARYRHPAVLIGWEWVGYGVALFLVRQLADSESEQRGVTAVLLASLVALAGNGVCQFLFKVGPQPVEYDRQRLVASKLQHLIGPEFVDLPPTISPHATATFASGDQLATFAILLLPVLFGAGLTYWLKERLAWPTLGAFGLVVVAVAALWLSYAPLAMAALAVATLVVLVFLAVRQQISWPLALGSVVALAGLSAAMYYAAGGFGRSELFAEKEAVRADLWAATWQLIGDNTWRGVGPGNVESPLLAKTSADYGAATPHSFVLDIWATSGLPAVACVVAAALAFVYLMGCYERATTDTWTEDTLAEETPPAPQPAAPNRYAHWEFYTGGMFGLLLGYLLREVSRSPDEAMYGVIATQDEMLHRSLIAGGRAVAWFLAFALFVNVPWSSRVRGVVLTTGAVAALLHLAVADGIGAPALMLPLLAVLGLALNARHAPPVGEGQRNWLALVGPFPLLVGLGFAYLLTVFTPILESETLAVNAQAEGRYYRYDREQTPALIHNKREYITDHSIKPLYKAVTEIDTGDSRRRAQLAYWYGELWSLWPMTTLLEKDGSNNQLYRATLYAIGSQDVDPEGLEGVIVEYHLHRRFAQGLKKFPPEEKQQLQEVVNMGQKLIERQPSNPRWHYLYARALFEAQQFSGLRAAVVKALEVDAAARGGQRLSPYQRESLRFWAKTQGEMKG